ncbi:16S rRNA (uracil(1498)-N(3))-methyltransferase [Candidatus Colwellia aromaticivorans]|uniref:16S rRNA (uracil(1498)-N(3))-methyltransferase n=1 Tax=Candidatus Colwellia aromaticivorans TaxID=2267621 RepID=UPI000DF195A5|nr:16S rRNA (uracil(1498)-N(3))-methyltransferase [Candidatus Colwellia aromaticivorans]
MSKTRIYQSTDFIVNSTVKLSDDAFGHMVRVLRLNEGDIVTLFNGNKPNGNEAFQYTAKLVDVKKKQASVEIISEESVNNESPLNIHLGQGISRGDRMDFTLQKSVELGVNKITPLFTERCGVKLSSERFAKKREQWQKIVISACEQSGRCVVPLVAEPMPLQDWINEQTTALKLNLHPKAEHSIMSLPMDKPASELSVRLLIGPEGGLTDEEISQANQADFQDILLGPRVLRTETAALTAITALQCRFGDLK